MKVRHAAAQLTAAIVIGLNCTVDANERPDSGAAASVQRVKLYVPAPPTHGERWVPGLHYNVLISPVAPEGLHGKVELLELSMYTSAAATDKFRVLLKDWLRNHSNTVQYVRRPSIVGEMPHARLQARMFFALEALGRSDLHEKLDAWVRDPQRNRIYHNIWAPDEAAFIGLTAMFCMQNGIDEETFKIAYRSPSIDERVQEAVSLTSVSDVDATPTFVIDRRFSVSLQRLIHATGKRTDEDFERLIRLVDYLTEAELSRR